MHIHIYTYMDVTTDLLIISYSMRLSGQYSEHERKKIIKGKCFVVVV